MVRSPKLSQLDLTLLILRDANLFHGDGIGTSLGADLIDRVKG